MTAIAFDTLKLARRLESAGFSHAQADGAAAALAETFSGDIATKSDIAEVKGEIAKLAGDLRGEIASLRASTAQWIISAVFVNILTVIGAIAAVWQLVRR